MLSNQLLGSQSSSQVRGIYVQHTSRTVLPAFAETLSAPDSYATLLRYMSTLESIRQRVGNHQRP